MLFPWVPQKDTRGRKGKSSGTGYLVPGPIGGTGKVRTALQGAKQGSMVPS